MNENKLSDQAAGSQTLEVDACDLWSVRAMAASPRSDDSGMAGSPFSCFDSSVPSSPASPHYPDQELCPNQNGNSGTVGSSSPNPDSPSIVTQTKGVDESNIQNLLQLLKTNSSSDVTAVISNLLINILSNSTKKTSVLQSPPLNPREVQKCPGSESGKRRSDSCLDEMVFKKKKVEAPNCSRVQPKIVILEQPEKNYRARYASEGCRGPVHGSSDLTYPTIQVQGYSSPLWVTVYLATNKGTPHFHLLCGPGSTKLPCRNILLPNGIPAIQVLLNPESGMTAVLDCLSIKRRRNFEADKELKRRGLNPVDWKAERKEACFVFKAEIPTSPLQVIACKSGVFQCTAPPGNPEIWWMKPVEGSVVGGEEIGLIGKKFPKGFKVHFFGDLPSVAACSLRHRSRTEIPTLVRHQKFEYKLVNASYRKTEIHDNGEKWEAYGDVDKTKSNTGAAVIRSPCLLHPITRPLTVNVEVCSCRSKGSNDISSDSMEFTYLPLEKPSKEDVIPVGLDILPDTLEISELIDAMSQYLPETNDQSTKFSNENKNEEWGQILSVIDQLHQNGGITEDQFQDLKGFVILEDTILLQAFRTTRESVSANDFLVVFCQYLAGLAVPGVRE